MGLSVCVLCQFRLSGYNYGLVGVQGCGGLESLNPKIHVALKISQIPETLYIPAAHKMSEPFSGLVGPRLQKTHERRNPRTEIGPIKNA